MEFTIFKLKFEGALHISGSREDYGKSEKLYHSDSLYAAAIACLSQFENGLRDVANTGDLGCTISSLFPYTTDRNKKEVFFLPKPFVQFNAGDLTNIAKKVKKAKWLDTEYFSRVLNNENVGQLGNSDDHKDGGEHLKGEYLTESDIDKDFLTNFTAPRIRVPRSGEEGNGDTDIFYMERLHFQEGSGLYFIASGDTSLLEKALKLLQIDGIGTDRNVGHGQFKYEQSTIKLKIPVKGDKLVSLGLYCPGSREEMGDMLGENGRTASYDIVNRGGWITSPGLGKYRKRSVYMFQEGSVFNMSEKETSQRSFVKGMVNIDLSPWGDIKEFEKREEKPHSIFRSGRSLFFPIVTQ